MSTNAIINVRNLDISRISFLQSPPKPGRIAGINIRYDGQNLMLRVPRLAFPFGASSGKNNPGPPTGLSATLNGCDSNGVERGDDATDIGRFYNFLLDLHAKILQAAIDNRNKWFPPLPNGKKPTEDNIRNSMKPLLNIHMIDDPSTGERVPSGKYPPKVNFKIPVYDNRVTMDVIDSKGTPVYVTPATLDTVFCKHSEANLVVSPSIYIMAGGGFGVSWRLKYAQVFAQQRTTAADVFANDIEEGDEEEVQEDAPAPAPAPAPELTAEDTALDVELPEEDATPAPAPAPAAGRGNRRRVVVPPQ